MAEIRPQRLKKVMIRLISFLVSLLLGQTAAAQSKKAYFFKESQYCRYDVIADKMDAGYPKLIKNLWPGLWSDTIDAAFNWGNGKVYFFKGKHYIRYDLKTDKSDPGYPKLIRDLWPGLWSDTIDAAINWGNGKVYFFKGKHYIRYDLKADKSDPGYPKLIKGFWPGLWSDTIDAAVNWGNGKVYFFKGKHYIRYDLLSDTTDPGYPKIIEQFWPKLWHKDLNAALNWEHLPQTNQSNLILRRKMLKTAVVEFNVHGEVGMKDAGIILAEWMTAALERTGGFEVYERIAIDKIIEELKFAETSYVDENSIAKFGKLRGVNTLVTGSIQKFGDTVSVTVKLIETESGKIIDTAEIKSDDINKIPFAMKKLAIDLSRED
ncbi:hemopexin repeat-containing protein [candidate division CSSED10-310 bacterium]|uniref:Hemopexin repeat-containing protein n=1 Tax=candidate division CSSED10-310 bacterium TaxID=2855610 RepID=A0ABV6YTY2_UNCC1